MSKMDELKSTLYSQGNIDERKLFSFVNSKTIPIWGLGALGGIINVMATFAGIGINGDKIIVFSASMGGLIGKVTGVLYEIPMDEIENFKMGKKLFLISYIRFTWQGKKFYFETNGMGGVDEAVKNYLTS